MNTPIPKPTFTVLKALQSDHLLSDTHIPGRVDAIMAAIPYDLGDGKGPQQPAAVLHSLSAAMATIPQMRLQRLLVPGEENSYHVDLTFTYEQIVSQSQRTAILATAFLGHLKALHTRINSFSLVFGIWWQLGAKEVMTFDSTFKGLLNDKQLGILATDEMSQYMGDVDVEIDAVMDAVEMLIANIKAGLKQAETTYQLGRDQINLSLSDHRVPNASVPGGAPRTLGRGQGNMADLRQVFGDRVAPQPSEEDTDEFPLAVPTTAAALNDEINAILATEPPPAEEPATAPVEEPAVPTEEVAAAPTEAAPEAAGEPAAATEATSPTRKRGEAIIVDVNLPIDAPGIAGKWAGFALQRTKTKLQLTAQTVSEENGTYKYMGADQPLQRLDDAGNPVAPAVITKEVEVADPFSKVVVVASTPAEPSTHVVDTPVGPLAGFGDDDTPAEVPEPVAAPAPVQAVASPAPVEAPAAPAPAAPVADDEDSLFGNIQVVKNLTPDLEEERNAQVSEPVAAPAPVETPAAPAPVKQPLPQAIAKPEPAPVAAPAPAPAEKAVASSVPPPFRSRSVAPGVPVVSKPFVPPKALAQPTPAVIPDARAIEVC